MLSRVILLLCIVTASAARADDVTDISPVRCAWSKLTPAQQERLQNEFSVDNSGPWNALRYTAAGAEETRLAASACNLSYDARQIMELRRALGARAAEEVGRRGVVARGAVDEEVIDRALARMHTGKRRIIGDFMACPDTKTITGEWDKSLIAAMRRVHIRTVDGRTVALIAVAMYSVMSQEGHVRRIDGAAMSCDEFD